MKSSLSLCGCACGNPKLIEWAIKSRQKVQNGGKKKKKEKKEFTIWIEEEDLPRLTIGLGRLKRLNPFIL